MTVSERILFPEKEILSTLESMRRPNGAFVASTVHDEHNYDTTLWLRDHLSCTRAYWDLGEYEKLRQGIWLVFDLFQKYERKIKIRAACPVFSSSAKDVVSDPMNLILHAKYDANTLEEITTDDGWGHDQLDMIGLFLHMVADADYKNIRIIRDGRDIETLWLLASYLRGIEYWHRADYGMWEYCKIRHSSSIGAVVGGLTYLKRQRLIDVPDPLIKIGEEALNEILPYESRDRCRADHHRHDCDAAQLSLIWPYHVVVKPSTADEIISRIIDGHTAENGERHHLLQQHGFNRHWGDDYYRSTEGPHRGISAEWPIFKFWASIVYSQRHEYKEAVKWFTDGCREIVDGKIPEAYQNGRPNSHTPLAWANATALIAFKKLPFECQQLFLAA